MPRIKREITARVHRKKVISTAKSFRGRRSNVYRIAEQAVIRAGQYVYHDRRNGKRVLRALWIARIDADAHEYGLVYNKFTNDLKKASVELDHKMLLDMAIYDKMAFAAIMNQVKANVA